jgi:hypothetical protein
MDLSTFAALLSMVTQPLVGLEYLIYVENESLEAEKNLSNFVCGLCTKHGNFHNMLAHLQSTGHRLKFLKTNLPSVAIALNFHSFTELQNSLLDHVCCEAELMLGRKAPSILTVKKSEDKWKVILGHFNGVLLNRAKPLPRICRDLIVSIQEKRKTLTKLIEVKTEAPTEKPRRERSRSPVQVKREKSRYSNRRDRSSSESRRSRSRENRHQNR